MIDKSLSGKTALVTGCGRGIGKAIAKTLAQAGADVVINDIDLGTAENLAKYIEDLGGKVLVCCGSVGVRQDVDAIFSRIKKEFNGLDILVNNAGITRDKMLLQMSDQEWDQVMDVNLKGVFYCIRAAASMMKEQGSGRIVNLTSVTPPLPETWGRSTMAHPRPGLSV